MTGLQRALDIFWIVHNFIRVHVWAAFILARPLGAVAGDFLDKPLEASGLALSRYTATAVLLILIVACILIFEHWSVKKVH